MNRNHIITASLFATSMVVFAIIYLVQGIALNGTWLMTTMSGIGLIATVIHGSDDYRTFVEVEES